MQQITLNITTRPRNFRQRIELEGAIELCGNIFNNGIQTNCEGGMEAGTWQIEMLLTTSENALGNTIENELFEGEHFSMHRLAKILAPLPQP